MKNGRITRRHWPGRIAAGGSSEQAAITMDWTATILAATGTKADASYPLDGEDLLPVLGGARSVYDRALFWRTSLRDAARVGNWKYLQESGKEHLFDLSIDPGEKNDLRARQPEVFEKIRGQFRAWHAQMLPKPPAT